MPEEKAEDGKPQTCPNDGDRKANTTHLVGILLISSTSSTFWDSASKMFVEHVVNRKSFIFSESPTSPRKFRESPAKVPLFSRLAFLESPTCRSRSYLLQAAQASTDLKGGKKRKAITLQTQAIHACTTILFRLILIPIYIVVSTYALSSRKPTSDTKLRSQNVSGRPDACHRLCQQNRLPQMATSGRRPA